MLFSEKQERSRRFRLALRMGIPILLLIAVVIFYMFRQFRFEIDTVDLALFVSILFISVYFLFFLINLGQAETYIDRMTGTFNRTSLLENLRKAVHKEPEYTVLLVRIDNLPFINDHYGIDRGDNLLRVMVHLMDEFFRLHGIKEPIIGRYHGGDFIVGLPVAFSEGIKRMEEFVSTYKEIGGVTVEWKFAAADKETADDPEALVTYLYDTLSQQHPNGNGKKAKPEKRLRIDNLEREIAEAVERGKLLLHYVPTCNLSSEKIEMMEVGVRLETKESGTLPPKKFIPVINRLGLEQHFDVALFSAICEDAKKVENSLLFSFNISPFSLRDDAFVEKVKQISAQTGVDFRRIVIELFENRAVKDIRRYKIVLEELRESGVRFALDNFGAQNASFEYIKQLPVDMVQFDREFTTSYNNPRYAALLKGYVQACKAMGVKTLVKWVDNGETYELFRQLGVDYAQGFYISNRPYDSETLIKKYGVKR